MALVAYDNSDSSDYEEDNNETKSTVIVKEESKTYFYKVNRYYTF